MARLGARTQGRDNNLNVIRLVAALAVLVSHAWPITAGPGTAEPLQALTGTTLGTYAVLVFFALSGFLITASFHRDPDPWRFCKRRARRLWPGLIICLILTVFCLGPLTTELSLIDYFSSQRTWSFLIVNGSMSGFQGDLPGVFRGNPYPATAGSIWTLQYEVACYALTLMIGLAGVLRNRFAALVVLGVGISAASLIIIFDEHVSTRLLRLSQFFLPFACGSLAWICRHEIPMKPGILIGLALLCLLAQGSVLKPVIEAVAIAYGTLLLGYARVRLPVLRGDYSYGIYIYAFPVQGLIVAILGAMDPWTNIALAVPLTFALAALSWHWVEQPWLRPQPKVKPRLAVQTRVG